MHEHLSDAELEKEARGIRLALLATPSHRELQAQMRKHELRIQLAALQIERDRRKEAQDDD